MEKTFLISQLKMIYEHRIIFEKLPPVKENDSVSGSLLDYPYFEKHFKLKES